MKRIHSTVMFAIFFFVLAACGTPHGQPQKDAEPIAPNQIVAFETLYAQNCSGCHGADGRGGASIALANPVYLAIVDESSVRNVVANGVRGTSMPAFAQSAGGMLTNEQIEAITNGIFLHWARNGFLDGANPPPYAATSRGNIEQGKLAFGTYCASCHGAEGGGTSKGSAITDDAYLALVSDQGLRTIVIAGRPELGAPDWRGDVPSKPMSDQEVTDVVAWLSSRRVQNPGQPYSAANYPRHSEK